MRSLDKITERLVKRGLKLSGPIARRDGDNSTLYAFVEVTRDSKGHQQPSNRRLSGVTKELLENEIVVEFILNDISNADFETGLRATLLHAFPGSIRNSFLSVGKIGAVVWIVPKSVAVREHLDLITNRISIYLENANIALSEVKLTVDENLPSRTAILSELRIAAPTTSEHLAERLSAKGFSAPPIDYLNRHLDALRRANQVIRRKDAHYCLTASALKVLGTVKRRSSPDITRFLDLARRGDIH